MADGTRGKEMRALTAFVSIAFIAAVTLTLSARQQPAAPAAIFTAAQANAGQAAYAANCASCHLPDLAGQNEAPQLAGTNFRTTWGKRTPKDLIEYISATMPPGRPSLADAEY